MIIEYVHKSNPNRVKTYDTQKSLILRYEIKKN